MDADRIEQFLSEQFCEFFGAINSIDKYDHLVES